MDSPEVMLRFGLILEAYLRGSPNHMAELQKQVCGTRGYKHTHTTGLPMRYHTCIRVTISILFLDIHGQYGNIGLLAFV